MGQGLGLQLRSGRRIGDDKLLVVKSRISTPPRRDRRLGKKLTLCIDDSYKR